MAIELYEQAVKEFKKRQRKAVKEGIIPPPKPKTVTVKTQKRGRGKVKAKRSVRKRAAKSSAKSSGTKVQLGNF